jgi:tetratricopeptide (TPR) repeat protein
MDYRLEQLRFELREDPSSRIFFKLGEHLRREGELDEAIEVLRTGLKQHGRYIAAWVSLGRAQLDNGDADGAHDSLERALQLDPENAVAARAMGEAAILKGDWVTAVKALKRARGLSPQDDALDERIVFVEERLAELGLLKTPTAANANHAASAAESEPSEAAEPPEPAASEASEAAEPPEPAEPAVSVESPPDAGEEPFTVKTGDTGQWDDSDDVFAAGWVEEKPASGDQTTDEEADQSAPEASAEAAADPSAFTEPPPLTEDDLASMVDADETSEPEIVVHQETSAAEAAEPAFSAPEPEPVVEAVPESELETAYMPAIEPEPESEPVSEPEPESESEAETAFLPALEPEPVSEPEAQPESEDLPESWPDPEADAGPGLEKDSDGLPLPTMTLARLAIDQGDLDLAERTLRGVLEREPGHSDAAELLDTLLAGPPDGDAAADATELSDPRAEALQRWLDAVRLASERLKT